MRDRFGNTQNVLLHQCVIRCDSMDAMDCFIYINYSIHKEKRCSESTNDDVSDVIYPYFNFYFHFIPLRIKTMFVDIPVAATLISSKIIK